MQILDGGYIYSATDLNNYLECGHLISLERRVAQGELIRPERNPTVALIADKGLQHEQRYLERLRAQYGQIVEITQTESSLEAIRRAAGETIAAMEGGAAVIYQGTFFGDGFLGKSDFLLRVEQPSARWPWSYEVADTKLALHDKPYFIIQLCHYSEHLARAQGTAPAYMYVVLGNGELKHFRFDDYSAYYRHLKQSFMRDVASLEAYPFVCEHCKICDWSPRCERQRRDDDHLSLVAWMRRAQVKTFEGAGIATVASLATANGRRPHGMQEATFARLRRQAALQVRGRETGSYHYELLDQRPFEGFGQLPMPATGDVFFDMEGDQFFEIGVGLEYLFGCYCPDDEEPFRAFWGTDRIGEKRAFEQCVDFFMERRRRYPAMHIYHYAPYEKTALRKLTQLHQTREEEVDNLLKGEVLVDLYAIVRQALMISQSSYSIKKIEPFYGMARSASVRSGDDSIVMFETWLKDESQRSILNDIERYNEEDCRSAWMLRDWLLERREEFKLQRDITLDFRPIKDPDARCHPEPVDGCKKCAERARTERERAKISDDQRALLTREGDAAAFLLGHLLSYHRREEKPVWWAFFDRCENVDQLLEFDKEAMAGLVLRRDIEPFKRKPGDRNVVYTYSFPDQPHHLPDKVSDPRTEASAGEVVAIDEVDNLIQVKRPVSLDDAAKLEALIPGGPINTDSQKESLARVARLYLDGSLNGRHPAAIDILSGGFPRFSNQRAGERIQPDKVTEDSVFDLVSALDSSCLFVQGPPGTGKTHIGARIIVRLLSAGKRVGVMANSHKAIHNLLHEIEEEARKRRVDLRGIHKHSAQNADSPYASRLEKALVASDDDNDAAENGDYNLISGNSWLFSRTGMLDRVDYLFIDEAGQTSLADAVAVSPSTQNLVLLGDPMQLAQVSQGVHAKGAGGSVLEHLLGERSTVPENRGVLLDTSYRMHPEICSFISEAFYDGRLGSDPPTANSRIASPGLSGSGLRYLPVAHSDNGRESIEEAERIVREVGLLLNGTFLRRDEAEHQLTQSDILVVTPYNAQRKRITGLLKAAGHDRVRVGTVDKFQGQQAPVVFYSMATSSGDDLPRNMEFLFERNRFNVAVSRAQCMSVLVCSPKLLDARCSHVEQMALVNLLCRYAEVAQ